MASVTTTPATVLETYVRDHLDDDPKAVLDIALAETERLRLVAAAKAEVLITPEGKFEVGSLEGLQRLAKMYTASQIVPDHFRGNGNIADCAIAVNLALRWGWDPLMVLQKCYIVHGRPGLESQLIIARANTSGVFNGRIGYELSGEGDRRQSIASAVLAESGETVTHTIDIALAKRMGWYDKKDRKGNLCSLWPKMPDLMLQYRSAAWLVRTVAPEVLMGVCMKEELEEMDEDDPTPATKARPSVEAMLEAGETALASDDIVGFPMKVLDPPETISAEQKPAETPQQPTTDTEEPPADAAKEEPAPKPKYDSIAQDRTVGEYRKRIEKASSDEELDDLLRIADEDRSLRPVSLKRVKDASRARRNSL
jgi:hypothetical protein